MLWLISVLPFYDVIINFIKTPFVEIASAFTDGNKEKGLLGIALIAVFFLTQIIFLLPKGKYHLTLTNSGRSSYKSAIIGGMVSALLSVGLLLMAWDLWMIWGGSISEENHNNWFGYFHLIAFFLSWIAWGIILSRSANRFHDHDAFTQMIYTRFLASSLLLYFLSQIAYGYHRYTKKDSCECAYPSFGAMMISVTVIFWLFGPGIFIVLSRFSRFYTRDKMRVNQD